MNVWILSLIICSANLPDGSYCSVIPLEHGLSHEACLAGIEDWRPHVSGPRLECTEDADLAALLEREERMESETGTPGRDTPPFL